MMDRMSKIDGALIGGLMLALVISIVMAFGGQCQEIRSQVLRLHILANSNSGADQALKLRVRDAVLEATGEMFAAAGDLAAAETAAREHLEAIRRTAQQEVARRGYDYPVDVEMVNMYFETRVYDAATLPAGYYDAVQVTIGGAEGRNWWCVMFPPMCVDAAAKNQPQLTREIQALGERPDYKMAFAGVELVEGLIDFFSGGKETAAAPPEGEASAVEEAAQGIDGAS